MSITDTLAAIGIQSNTTPRAKGAASLDMDDFLQLMTTQLKNQDPFKPLDSTEFVAQLAQFSTVSGIDSMRNSLSSLSESLRASQALSGATMVGRSVLAPQESARLIGGQGIAGAVQVPEGASSVQLAISDGSGQVIRHMAISNITGLQGFRWDGLGDDGTLAAGGIYQLKATADFGGQHEALATSLAGRVSSVSIDTDSSTLILNTPELGAVALASVQQIF